MEPLAGREVVIGFFSYSREDDKDSSGALSALRLGIQTELRSQLGRSPKSFFLWQDKVNIAAGSLWQEELKAAVNEAVFFIPIITPTSVGSPHCRFEFESFIERERALGRRDLLFPVLYIAVPELEDDTLSRSHPTLRMIEERQYVDWRELRFCDAKSAEMRAEIARFCKPIVKALWRRMEAAGPGGAGRMEEPGVAAPSRWRRALQQHPTRFMFLLTAMLALVGGGGFLTWDLAYVPQRPAVVTVPPAPQVGSRTPQPTAPPPAAGVRPNASLEALLAETAKPGPIRGVPPDGRLAGASPDPALQAETARQEAARQEAARQEAARQEAARQEAARQEAARQEFVRQEAARQQMARLVQARLDMLRTAATLLAATPDGTRRWTTLPAPATCAASVRTTYTAVLTDNVLTWTNGVGDRDRETVEAATDQGVTTSTIGSEYLGGRTGERPGTSWEYRVTGDRLDVIRNGQHAFWLRRCG